MNPKRWVLISYGLAAVAVFLVLRQLVGFVWDYFRLPLFEEWGVVLPDLVSAALAGIIFFVLKQNRKANEFMLDVVAELSKVTWPLRKETLVSAVIVIIMVGIASVILFLFDTVWGTGTQRLLAF